MRIVHALHAFPPFSRAGSENYVEALARAQGQRHEVTVFHRVSDPSLPEYAVEEGTHRGIPVVRLNRTFRDFESFRDTYRSDAVAAAFAAFLDRARPDIVHFHHVTCLSTTCVSEAKRRGIGVVFTLHDFWLECPRGQRLRRDLSLCTRHDERDCVRCMAHQLPIRGGHLRTAALDLREKSIARWPLPASWRQHLQRRPFASEAAAIAAIVERAEHVRAVCGEVDRFVSPSRFLRDRFVEWGIPADRIAVIDCGMEPPPAEALQRPPRDDARLRVVYIGTWIPSKGVHLLVEAFRDLPPTRAVLDLYGYAPPFDGFPDYEEHLRRLARGAAHVRFNGPYDPEAVFGILSRADLMVVPSLWWENSPLTIHEAFLAGVPVVAAGHGGMAELVRDGLEGWTFQPGSAAALRSVLQRLLDDDSLLGRLAPPRGRVAEIGAHARELEALYGRALDSSRT